MIEKDHPSQALSRRGEGHFSLTLALQAVGQEKGFALDFDELNAALGLSLMVCLVGSEADPANWPQYGHDLFLREAAQFWGMQLRELHPYPAAFGLETAAEFEQHFHASYKPLIERALENQQSVLAWRGWPGEHALSWGVIRRVTDEGLRFVGIVTGSNGDPQIKEVVLTKPATQVYVIERMQPPVLHPSVLLLAFLIHGWRVLREQPLRHLGIISGPPALTGWTSLVKCADSPAYDTNRCLAVLIGSAAERFLSAQRFLRRQFVDRSAEELEQLQTLHGAIQQTLDPLQGCTTEEDIRRLRQQAQGAADLEERIKAASDCLWHRVRSVVFDAAKYWYTKPQ